MERNENNDGGGMLKAILFDLDNTLLDFSGFKRESAHAAAKAMKKAGIPLSEKELYDRIYKVYDEKGIEYQRTFGDVLYGLELTQHELERARQAAVIAYTKKKYECIKPRPKVIQMLSSLKRKYKLGIVTDAPREKAWQRLILSGLDGFFYPVVTYNDTLEHKPSLKPFELALFLLKVKPDEVLFVGDNPERDIIGAKKAGLHTCLAKYGCVGYTEEVDVADYSIGKFEELEKTIQKFMEE
jgi:putative hydrolase of the HAD superfamily